MTVRAPKRGGSTLFGEEKNDEVDATGGVYRRVIVTYKES